MVWSRRRGGDGVTEGLAILAWRDVVLMALIATRDGPATGIMVAIVVVLGDGREGRLERLVGRCPVRFGPCVSLSSVDNDHFLFLTSVFGPASVTAGKLASQLPTS